jgi:hypothetical protein
MDLCVTDAYCSLIADYEGFISLVQALQVHFAFQSVLRGEVMQASGVEGFLQAGPSTLDCRLNVFPHPSKGDTNVKYLNRGGQSSRPRIDQFGPSILGPMHEQLSRSGVPSPTNQRRNVFGPSVDQYLLVQYSRQSGRHISVMDLPIVAWHTLFC